MVMMNDTLKRKLESKKEFLLGKIAPLHEELEMVEGMLKQISEYEDKAAKKAEEKLGLTHDQEER